MNKCILFLMTAFIVFNLNVAKCQVVDSQQRRVQTIPPKRPASRVIQNDSINNKRKKDSLTRTVATRKKTLIADSIKNKKRRDSIKSIVSIANPVDSNKSIRRSKIPNPVQRPVAAKPVPKDSLLIDSTKVIALAESSPMPALSKYQTNISHTLMLQNKFINIKQAPVYFLQLERKVSGKEILFYTVCLLIFLLGLFKTFFYGYFNNLFRVFFNTSLRQSQLTDQLLQARLPSLILNILFVLSAGLYAWLLFTHFDSEKDVNTDILLPICIGGIAVIYLVKFLFIKFMGWLGGIQSTTNNYIFIIFLINKIIGILLIPFIILLAFSNPAWIGTIATISFLLLGLFFLARYVKSYSSLDSKLKINPFHFAIYIIGGEIFPLLILYKLAVDYVF